MTLPVRRVADVAEGGADEAAEQRMAVARRGGEFRMELAGEEPGMVGISIISTRRSSSDLPEILSPACCSGFEIAVVEFVAVAMAFGDHVLAVEFARQGAGPQPAFLRAQAHGAAQIGILRCVARCCLGRPAIR